MRVGVIIPDREIGELCSLLENLLGEAPQVYPHISRAEEVESLLVWKHPRGIFAQFPRLKLVSSLGAGVDHIIGDSSLNEEVKITRVVYPNLGQAMARYAVGAVLQFHKSLYAYHQCKEEKSWDGKIPFEVEMKIGVMGMGKMGKKVAESLLALGFEVYGFSKSPKFIPGIRCYSKSHQQLPEFLQKVNTLICLLPLTPETKGVLDASIFSQLPQGSYLINLGRGDHLVEKDLINAIESGKIVSAYLDVFQQEPLPSAHPFWTHPQVFITPHIASITDPGEAAHQFALNHKRLQMGKALVNQIDRKKGY